MKVEELETFWRHIWLWDISVVRYPAGICGDIGVIGVIGDVVDELNAGDIDWSSEEVVVHKWLRWGSIIGTFEVDVDIGDEIETVVEFDNTKGDAEDFAVGFMAVRFSIAEFLRIIMVLVFGNSRLLVFDTLFVYPWKFEW